MGIKKITIILFYMDSFTTNKLIKINNPIFKNNILDAETNKIVKKIRLKKMSNCGKILTPLIWEYFRDRAKTNVNNIINLHKRENLIIIYSIQPNANITSRQNQSENII